MSLTDGSGLSASDVLALTANNDALMLLKEKLRALPRKKPCLPQSLQI